MSESLKMQRVRVILGIILSMPMNTTEMGCQNRVNTCPMQKYSLVYSTRVTAADRTGRETFSPAFTTHSGIFVHFENTAQPLSAVIPQRRGVSFKIRASSRQQTVVAERRRAPRSQDQPESLQKDSTGRSLPLSSLGMCICLDHNIFLLDFHDSTCCHIVNRSDCLDRVGNQRAGKLFQAPVPTRSLLISLSKAQLIH